MHVAAARLVADAESGKSAATTMRSAQLRSDRDARAAPFSWTPTFRGHAPSTARNDGPVPVGDLMRSLESYSSSWHMPEGARGRESNDWTTACARVRRSVNVTGTFGLLVTDSV